MTEFKIATHTTAAQVEITVFHAEVIAAVGIVLNGERRHIRLVEHIKLCGYDLDIARGKIGILALALGHLTGDLHHIFAAEMICRILQGGIIVVKNYLGYSIAVAEVEECHSSHLAHALYPSGESHFLTYVGLTKFATSVSSVHNYI